MENNNGVKKKKKRGIGLIILAIVAIVIVGLVATGIAGAREAMKALKEMNIKSYTVADGTVEKTVSGSGQIEAADTEDVTAPVGVKVDKVLVSTGDTVTKGQKLAEIDADSITDCLVEIESSLKSISDQLDEDAKKKADDEDKLTDLQKEQLNNESDELKKAQTELNALKSNPYITASTDGIIGDVNITEGSSISQMSGSSSSSISSLGEDASSYLSGAMGSVSSTTVSGPATGTTADVVTMVPVSEAKAGAAATTSAPVDSSTTISNGSAGADSASGGSGTADSSSTANNNAADSSSTSGSNSTADSSSTSGGNGASDGTTDRGDSTAQQKVTSWDVLTSRMTAPAAGAAPVTAAQLFADVDGKTFAEACHYTGTIGWIEIPADSSQGSNQGTSSQGNQTQDAQTQGTQPGFATFSDGRLYTAVITLSAADGYVFSSDSEPSPSAFDGALTSLVRTEISGDGRAMTILVPYVLTPENTLADTLEKLTQQEQQAVTALQQLISQGLSGLSGLSGLNALSDLSKLSGLNGANAGGLLNGLSGLNGASAYGLSAADALSGAAGNANVSYSPYESIAFTVRKTDRMKVQVSIDEQDILLLSKGQKADVTLDALEGQTFEGTVTEIGADAETGSGSAKYPVTIEIDSADDMKFGMSAEVTVKVGEAADVLVIPMDALQQEGETTFVYTEEADDGTLGGKKNVETGLSDGENVEITSGLSDGDTIYYQKADSSNTFSSPFMDESTSSSSSSSS
ncbi:MAG: HlyD family efflux transporter periplasmic adaptor subunit [Bilifractor sp.]|jgi:multidrug efflux pump subunit AcrA (membrane-fusion protein)